MEANMDQNRRAVWERYVASWKAATATEKTAIYETCLAPNCAYTDPLVQANGWDELLAYMLDFHRQLPGAHFVTEQFIEHHQRSIARWKMMNVDAIAIGDGVSYAEYDLQGRLVAMTGFFEAPKG
jgi:hypothetical protein